MSALVKKIIGGKQESPFDVRFVTVQEDFAGQRLDNFLLRELKGVPKTHVYRIIRSGEVRLNKGRAHADTRVSSGDVIRLPPVRVSSTPELTADAPVPPREFPVLFEDALMLAIDKPAGVAVHGGSGVSFGVIEQLRRARPALRYLELVHRLDRETSGILLLAKRRSALTALQDQFRSRQTGKTYLALVDGDWPARLKVLDAPLARYVLAAPPGATEPGERRVRVVAPDHADAMAALTLVRPLARFSIDEGRQPLTLLAVTIKTGRTHQIRVHLASAGHPIAGDEKYAEHERCRALHRLGLRRMFLHAWQLQFDHPASTERLTLRAPLPSELQAWLPREASTMLDLANA